MASAGQALGLLLAMAQAVDDSGNTAFASFDSASATSIDTA